jgi:hypothetical protein
MGSAVLLSRSNIQQFRKTSPSGGKNALAGQMRPYLARMMLWRISPHHSLFRIFPPLILPLPPLGAEHRFFHYFCRPETA